MSHDLNEGNNRATARVSMRRERNTTLNYATARSVAESFCSGGPNADISDSSAVASDETEK